MPHTMPKRPTHSTGRKNEHCFAAAKMRSSYLSTFINIPGETSRQFADRVKIADAEMAAARAAKAKRKPRAKKAAD
jgi:hypothetical protein